MRTCISPHPSIQSNFRSTGRMTCANHGWAVSSTPASSGKPRYCHVGLPSCEELKSVAYNGKKPFPPPGRDFVPMHREGHTILGDPARSAAMRPLCPSTLSRIRQTVTSSRRTPVKRGTKCGFLGAPWGLEMRPSTRPSNVFGYALAEIFCPAASLAALLGNWAESETCGSARDES